VEIDHQAPLVARREIEIEAPQESVWKLLTDVEGWPSWNNDVESVSLEGALAPGSTFRWKAGPGTIVSTFEVVDPPREVGWSGKTFGVKALHVYRFEPTDTGTRVATEESWSGIPVHLFRTRMTRTMIESLEDGLERLKAAAEQRTP
jgi:uncharacterized protein YndB with AHSA1/START domain